MQLMIIDGLNLIRRIYAAQERPYLPLPNEISDATKTQIIHNVIGAIQTALRKLLTTLNPTHGIMIFDSTEPSWRHQIYPQYKAGRQPMPAILAQSMDQIKQAIEAQGLCIYQQNKQEADDLIGTLAQTIASNQKNCTIISTDKGFLQLLSDHIAVYDYFGRTYLDEQHVEDKFGVPSRQLINYWSLVGDSSNNITGLAGIGPKAALDILLKHQSLNDALNSELLAKKLREKLHNQLETFKLCRQLVALKTDIQLGLNLKELRLAQSAEPLA